MIDYSWLTVNWAHSKNICMTKYAHTRPCFTSDGGIIGCAAQWYSTSTNEIAETVKTTAIIRITEMFSTLSLPLKSTSSNKEDSIVEKVTKPRPSKPRFLLASLAWGSDWQMATTRHKTAIGIWPKNDLAMCQDWVRLGLELVMLLTTAIQCDQTAIHRWDHLRFSQLLLLR